MNILAAAVTLQSWIKKEQIALFVDDAETNFCELFEMAQDDNNEEILAILNYIESVEMIEFMLGNKAA